jgi:UDP-MurNAc hydroxylase
MKVKLISQASVIIKCSDATIWTDPWLKGKAFNNSWSLHPKPEFNLDELDQIDYMWISHEHPDHFHFQTLKSLPQSFKNKVTVLFQDKNNEKMPNAFKQLGFSKVQLIPNAKMVQLTPETEILVYQVGGIDSTLGIKNKGQTLLNLNDCELTPKDYKTLLNKFSPKIDILLNQFSLAGNNGARKDVANIADKARNILDRMIYDHKIFNASLTIPFASYVYFSSVTNKYINQYHNSVEKVKAVFNKASLTLLALYINDEFDLDAPNLDDTLALAKLTQAQSKIDELPYDSYPEIPFEELKKSFDNRTQQLRSHYPAFMINKLGKMTAFIEDSNYAISFSAADNTFQREPSLTIDDVDLILHSQPLSQAFSTTWGVQTMGVGAQYFIEKNQSTWKWYRIITVLNNANVYLKFRYIFSADVMRYVFERIKGNGISQLMSRLQKSKENV